MLTREAVRITNQVNLGVIRVYPCLELFPVQNSSFLKCMNKKTCNEVGTIKIGGVY